MKRQSWHIALVVLAMFIALGVIACSGTGGATPTASPIPTPIYRVPQPTTAPPTFSPTPVPTPDPDALAVRPCLAEDLVVGLDHSAGAAGNIVVYMGVANVSSDACRVHGAPGLQMIDQAGTTVVPGAACGSVLTSPDRCPDHVAVLQPGPRPPAGPYTASFNITWTQPNFTAESCPDMTSAVAIELPDNGGLVYLGGVVLPSCARPGISEFRLTPTPTPTPDPTVGYR